MSLKKTISVVLRIGVSFGALGLIVYFMRDHLGEAIHILKTDISWQWFGVAVGGYFIANVLLGFRLRRILLAQDVNLKRRDAVYLSYLGLFFNLFLPSAVGGDVAKGYFIYKHTNNKLVSTTGVIVDRICGFVVLMTMAGIAMAFFSREIGNPKIALIVACFVGLMMLVIIFFSVRSLAEKFAFLGKLIPSSKWRERIASFYHTIHGYRNHPEQIVFALFFAFVAQCFFILVHYWAARSVGVELNPLLFFALVPVITIASMAPSLGGLGVREAGMIFVFSQFMASERALALSLIMDIIIYGFSLIAGIVFALKGGLKEKFMTETQTEPSQATP